MRKSIRWSLIALVSLILIGLGIWYYEYSRFHPNTEDAYLAARVVQPAPLVAGRIVRVYIHNHETVRAGTLLYRIDPTPYRIAVARARASLSQAQQTVRAEMADVRAQEANVRFADAIFVNDLLIAKRAKNLLHEGYGTRQTYDNAVAALKSARARLHLAQAQLAAAQQKLGRPGSHNQLIRIARANLDEALWRLKQTKVHATCDGAITTANLHPGDMASPGVSPFVIVCNNDWWVNANFKETDLTPRFRSAMPHRWTSPCTRTTPSEAWSRASARPPERPFAPSAGNATGNWVKVTQRIPVRIAIVDPSPAYPLRVGASVSVTVEPNHPLKVHDAH
ncbi:multidrug resistance protein A [mine drainage metagenome]|uniref:Multidrug resistance protein A n=1 Tax=mine drainage metagenome TaxID=410659 RepID=T0ZTA9_9ZZZZ